MRVLLLTQWFEPENVPKGLAFAKALRSLGHDVEVLTGFPNYPSGKIFEPYRVSWRQREYMDGVRVTRVPLYASHGASRGGRAANFLSFAVSASTIGTFSVPRADIVYLYHPPATTALAAWAMRALRHMPFVCDVQDLWPDSLPATGMLRNPLALQLIDRWCRVTYHLAARVVVLSPGFKQALMSRGVPESKIEVIYNWCDDQSLGTQALSGQERQELGLEGRRNVMFAGNLGLAQGLDAVLDAAKLLKQRRPDIQFVFVGSGLRGPHLRRRACEEGITNVRFLPAVPFRKIGAYLRAADVLLVSLNRDPLFRITIPSKIQTYMAVGKPTLCAVEGDAAQLLDGAKAGIGCTPEDPRAIAGGVERLLDCSAEERSQMGRNGAEYYRRELSLAAGAENFSRLFEAVVQERAP